MKLLITTQAVNKNDPILGFFHRWIEEFAKHFEEIHVICLYEGEHALPPNVHVYSLGKENGENRLKYVWRFYTIVCQLSGKYEAVFSHMNPHYIVLAGWYWKLKNTPLFLWRNHARMNRMTQIAAPMARKVFYTSPYACTAVYPHAVQMPVGIDTDFFISGAGDDTHSTKKKILSLGRISPVKKLEILTGAAALLSSDYEVHIYGDAPAQDQSYVESLKARAGKNVFFHGAVKNDETPALYRSHDVFVNLTPKGSMDKTVLEAVACGALTISANESFMGVIPQSHILSNSSPESLAEYIEDICLTSDVKKDEIRRNARTQVIENHSLAKLGDMLYNYIYEQR